MEALSALGLGHKEELPESLSLSTSLLHHTFPTPGPPGGKGPGQIPPEAWGRGNFCPTLPGGTTLQGPEGASLKENQTGVGVGVKAGEEAALPRPFGTAGKMAPGAQGGGRTWSQTPPQRRPRPQC